jgi:hypothetical protein
MNFHSQSKWIAPLAMMTAGFWTIASNAADDRTQAAQPENNASNPYQIHQLQRIQGRVEDAALSLAGARGRASVSGNIRAAAEAVRDAKGDDAKTTAQKKLAELLGKCFDEDTERRQKELTQIEERLTKLRELLDRRRTKKQDILDLQMKVALNEADGLGFYDSEQPGGPKTGNFFYRTEIDGSPVDGAGSVKVSPATGKPFPKAVSGSSSSPPR